MRRIETEIAIFGAGIIGAACAYELAKAGRRVVLVDRDQPNAGSSGACDGYVSVSTKTPGPALELARASQLIYPDLARELGAECVEYVRRGGMMLIETQDDIGRMETHARQLREAGVDASVIDRKALLEREPALSPDLHGGVDCPGEAQVTPYLVTLALVEAAVAKSARTLWRTRPVAFELAGSRIAKADLVDADGEALSIVAEQYVFCVGIWSQELGAMVGLDLPVVPRRGELLVTTRGRQLSNRFLVSARYLTAKLDPEATKTSEDPLLRMGYGFTLEPTPHGQHIIGNTRTFVGYDRRVSPEGYRTILAEGAKRLPALASLEILRSFAGLRPFVPDKRPLIGQSLLRPNLFVAAGHEGDGITLAPITARIITSLMLGKPAPIALDGLSPDRFSPAAQSRRN